MRVFGIFALWPSISFCFQVMSMLHVVIPEAMRPYSLLHTFTTDSYQMITSLTFHGNDKLIAGSRDCNVSGWICNMYM
jgi:hypothetical protein